MDKKLSLNYRKSNYELLRILAMLLIIAGHFYGQTSDYHTEGGIFLKFFCYGLRVAVNLFLMIGVYFMVEKRFNASRVFKIWNCVWFWSVTLTAIIVLMGIHIQITHIFMCMFPVFFYNLWFASAYIILLLLSPSLNFFCTSIYNAYRGGVKTLVLLALFTIIIVGQSTWCPNFMDTWLCANIYFMYIYTMVWFIKKDIISFRMNKYIVLFVGLLVYIMFVFIACSDIPFLSSISERYLMDYKSLPNIIIASCVFYYFKEVNIGRNKVINTLSSVAFGVYVIHQVPHWRDFFWTKILKIDQWGHSEFFDAYFLGAIIAVYLICGMLEYIRQNMIENYLIETNFVKKITTRMTEWLCI